MYLGSRYVKIKGSEQAIRTHIMDINPRIVLLMIINTLTLLLVIACVTDKDVLAEAVRKYEEGRSYQDEGNITRAGESYHDSIGLNPRLAEAYVGRGYVHYVMGATRLAMDDFNKAIDLDPRLAEAYNYRGLLYVTSGDSQAALLSFTKAIQINPDHGESYYNRAKFNEDIGDYESAIADMSEVLRLQPDSPVFYMERSRLYLLVQDTDRAIADLEQVLAITLDDKWVVPAKQLLSALRQDG